MSTELPTSQIDAVEITGLSTPDTEDTLWGPIPRESRLAWLRVAAQNWPIYPGAAVGGMTNAALSNGQLVHSEALVRVARNAFEAGFTPDEYQLLRSLIRWRVPAHMVTRRSELAEHRDDYIEIDARQWRGWLDRVRAGQPAEVATIRVLGEQRRQEPNAARRDPTADAGRRRTEQDPTAPAETATAPHGAD